MIHIRAILLTSGMLAAALIGWRATPCAAFGGPAACDAVIFAAAGAGDANEDAALMSPKLEAEIDAATDRALEFLAKLQHKNGSWHNSKDTCATTSLAVMAFLAKGHQPGEQPYGEAMDRAIDFVVSQQKPNGLLVGGSGQMYAHGISTLMLAEVVGHTTGKRHEQVSDALAKAVKLILDAQKVKKHANWQGGWRYQPTSADSDISCTGWQLMALRAAKNAGADVPAEAIAQAVAYIERSTCKDGGFAYQPGGPPNHARTGTGILALELCGKHHAKPAIAGGDWLLQNPLHPFGSGNGYQYYTMYYCSQAMFQLGGKYWTQFWPSFAQEVLKRQQKDGSWPLGVSAEQQAGPAYGTSMAVLSLCVHYRLLPIYQR